MCYAKLTSQAHNKFDSKTTYPNVVDLQAMDLPCPIDPVQNIPHCCCSVIEWVKDSTTNPAWERPW